MKITINPDKNIGKVVYIVEGEVFEPELLKEIFHNIFDFKVFAYNKNNNVVIEFKKRKTNIQKFILSLLNILQLKI